MTLNSACHCPVPKLYWTHSKFLGAAKCIHSPMVFLRILTELTSACYYGTGRGNWIISFCTQMKTRAGIKMSAWCNVYCMSIKKVISRRRDNFVCDRFMYPYILFFFVFCLYLTLYFVVILVYCCICALSLNDQLNNRCYCEFMLT